MRSVCSRILFVLVAIAFASVTALAVSTQTFNAPYPGDLYDLDHGSVYTWRISNVIIPTGQTVVGATLNIKNIRDWTNETNTLFIHLFDTAVGSGVQWASDAATPGISDNLAGPTNYLGLIANNTGNTSLAAQSFGTTGVNYGLPFNQAQLVALRSYLTNGNNVALGFDPDCHFFNDGVSFSITTGAADNPVPEPGSLMLLGSGLVGLAGWARRRVASR